MERFADRTPYLPSGDWSVPQRVQWRGIDEIKVALSQVDAVREGQGHAGSTPATSTISLVQAARGKGMPTGADATADFFVPARGDRRFGAREAPDRLPAAENFFSDGFLAPVKPQHGRRSIHASAVFRAQLLLAGNKTVLEQKRTGDLRRRGDPARRLLDCTDFPPHFRFAGLGHHERHRPSETRSPTFQSKLPSAVSGGVAPSLAGAGVRVGQNSNRSEKPECRSTHTFVALVSRRP